MKAHQFQVSFGFNEYDNFYYTKQLRHKGNDRSTPCGTELWINGTKCALTGTTGLSSGCHLHTQVGKDMYAQEPINPTPHEFKSGTVVEVGYASAWGNYFIVQSGVYYCVYAHLQKIFVKKGQEVGSMKYKDIKDGYTLWKKDQIAVFGQTMFKQAEYHNKYQNWDRWKFNRQLAITQYKNVQSIRAELAQAREELANSKLNKDDFIEYERKIVDLENKLVEADTTIDGFIDRVINAIRTWLKGNK